MYLAHFVRTLKQRGIIIGVFDILLSSLSCILIALFVSWRTHFLNPVISLRKAYRTSNRQITVFSCCISLASYVWLKIMRLNHTCIGYLSLYIRTVNRKWRSVRNVRTVNRKWRSVRKDDGPCETYGPSPAVGPGVIIRCMLCIRTVSKNGGPCETYGLSTTTDGP